ncbi:MAG: MerR family transcriptional regulator, light-induced transcriptional regulator [Thermoleophilaceae bacterium]|nr:MerR family transcriptional regulator, light-induced transcriptional regulator [Thermoleophilaceae bacterium]
MPVLTIREVAAQTGVSPATLRMWEARYGFPVPERLPSGHRRYSDEDVERVRRVVVARDAGLSMRAAVERALGARTEPETSVFAALRRRRPDLAPYLLPKRTLIALSHAIEDECCARAERPVLIGGFQRPLFFRHAETRWRELARTARAAVVFAEFPKRRDPAAGPVEVPIEPDHPSLREWELVCDAPDYAAFLAAWERPGQDGVPDADRAFETIWSVEPELVREAAHVAAGIVTGAAPDLASTLHPALAGTPPPAGDELRLVGALTNRMVAYVATGEALTLPAPRASRGD